MASVRKRKMARSSVKKVTRRTKEARRKVRVSGSAIVAENWDPKLTFEQNYKRLGLRSRLGVYAGGVEKKVETLTEIRQRRDEEEQQKVDIAAIENTEDPAQIPEGEARLIRDPETNEVIKVIHGTMKVGSTFEKKPKSVVIQKLEEEALKNAAIIKGRDLSEREVALCEALYKKYGEDYEKMKWDRRLNPMQHSPGVLKAKMSKWLESQ